MDDLKDALRKVKFWAKAGKLASKLPFVTPEFVAEKIYKIIKWAGTNVADYDDEVFTEAKEDIIDVVTEAIDLDLVDDLLELIQEGLSGE